ncbi:hypothetical protein BSLG_004365 [Batrachochytrium salamandrivorans]|nr:hypothetical protein BSLG_004365 [Batrachochytrium salamandrivorans]
MVSFGSANVLVCALVLAAPYQMVAGQTTSVSTGGYVSPTTSPAMSTTSSVSTGGYVSPTTSPAMTTTAVVTTGGYVSPTTSPAMTTTTSVISGYMSPTTSVIPTTSPAGGYMSPTTSVAYPTTTGTGGAYVSPLHLQLSMCLPTSPIATPGFTPGGYSSPQAMTATSATARPTGTNTSAARSINQPYSIPLAFAVTIISTIFAIL